jgi:hypothetical protein
MNNTPSTDSPSWRSTYWGEYLMPLWRRVSDCYHGLHTDELKRRYLRQQMGEHDKVYESRIQTVAFENRLSPSVKSHAGLLSDYRLDEDAPQSVQDSLNNEDGQGNSLESALLDWDIDALLYNDSFALVDVPIPEGEEELRAPRSPRIVEIGIKDIYAPAVGMVQGQLVITQISIRRSVTEQDGGFGTKARDRHWVYRLVPLDTPIRRGEFLQTMQATYEVWQEVDDEDKALLGDYEQIEQPRPILDATGNPLDRIPLVWYSPYGDPLLFYGVDNAHDRGGTPEYLSLVDLNLEYFNKHSEINTAESRGNFVIMKMSFPGQKPTTMPDLITGNRMAVLEGGADLTLLEPQGTALSSTRDGQDRRIQRMDAIAQSFLTGGDVAMTATQAAIEASQSRLGLRNIARRKESAVQQIFYWWERFSNPQFDPLDTVGGITVAESVLTVPPSPQELQFWQTEYTNGSLNRAQYHAKQKELGVFSEEMERLETGDDPMNMGLGLSNTPVGVTPDAIQI